MPVTSRPYQSLTPNTNRSRASLPKTAIAAVSGRTTAS